MSHFIWLSLKYAWYIGALQYRSVKQNHQMNFKVGLKEYRENDFVKNKLNNFCKT